MCMVDLWKLGVSVFMLAIIFAVVEIVTKYSESTAGVILVLGFIGFALSLAGAIAGSDTGREYTKAA